MSRSQFALRSLLVSVSIFAIATNSFASSWGEAFWSLFNFEQNRSVTEETTGNSPAAGSFVIGSCDIANVSNPVEIESTGGTTTPTAYTNLGAAFAAINAGTHTGSIAVEICADTNEGTATALLSASGTGSSSYTDISIKPVGGAARTITGATTAGSPLIDLNGADNVTIDGLNAGGNSLTISNTTASATSGTSTIRFIGGATGNTITNSNIQGSVTSSVATNGATIFFSTDSATANGNDNNTISNNNIGPAGTNLPTKAILGNGSTTTTGVGNSGNVINNNNIFDYFGAAVTSAGIATNGGCNTWTITNNRLYQTATRTWTTGALHSGINIANTTATSGAQGFTITGNTIGYASNTQTGTYTLTGAGTGAKFQGIVFNGIIAGTTTNVNNNTVAGVSMTGVTASGTTTSSPFTAILLQEGNLISNGNTVGSQSAAGSLTFSTTTTSSADVYGIFNFSSNAWTANNNNVGGISVTNLGASGTFLMMGMRAFTTTTTPWNASGNNVGGTVANSMQLSATGASSQVLGLYTSNAPAVLTSNTIRNLTSNIGSGTTTAASVIGIGITSATPSSTLSQNTIFNLSNTNATAASVVTGIQFNGATANVIERNFVHSLTAATNSTAAEINGIRIAGGTTVYRNNMIAIGAGIANAVGTTAANAGTVGINGILEAAGTNSFWHNSVYIGGSPTAGAGASYAFNESAALTTTRSIRDNIFFNARSNSGSTGKNYAIKINGTAANPTGLTINNNLYYANGSGAAFGFFNSLDVADLSGWKTAVGLDAGSFEADPKYIDPTNAVPNLHLNASDPTLAEGNGVDVGVTNDFDGETRASLTPVDIGADAGNFVGIDASAPAISYSTLANTTSLSARNLTVTITDVTGVATGATAPRVYFNKNAGTWFSAACSLTSGTTNNGAWNCTIDYSLISGVIIGDVVRYYVVAQDTLGNVGANPSSGFAATNVNTVTTPPTTPNQYSIVTGYGGALSVGTDQTVTSLTNTGGLFELINAGAITSNTTVTLTTDLTAETGTVSLNQTTEEGAGGYTITIQPSGARTIYGSNTTALINLNGADRITFNGLNSGGNTLLVRNTSTTTGQVFQLTNDASNNTLTNLTIEGGNTNTSGALVLLATGVSTGNDNNSITNNVIRDRSDVAGVPANMVASLNASTTATNSFNTVSGNQISNFINNGFATSSGATSDNWNITNNDLSQNATRAANTFGFNTGGMAGTNLISGNTIHGFTTSSTFSTVAFLVGNSLNLTISKNKVYDFQTTSAATGTIEGLEFDGASGGAATVNVVNNMITLAPTVSTSQAIIGIQDYGYSGNTFNAFNNSIYIGGIASGTAATWAMKRGASAPTTYTARNNFCYNDRTGGGANHFAAGDDSANTGTFVSDRNIFIGTGVTAANFMDYGTASTGTAVAFTAWQTGPPTRDANSIGMVASSVTLADQYVSASTGNLHTTLNSLAMNIGAVVATVTTDFDGDARPSGAGYEIGADEIDQNAPDTTITSNPTDPSSSSSATFTFTGSDSAIATVTGFECSLDSATFAACTSPTTYSGLSQGSHNFQVRAKDGAGNVDATPASYTWVVDAIAPDTTITSTPPNPSASADATFTFSGTDSLLGTTLLFECSLDSAAYSACTTPKTYTGLSDGSHTFAVRAKDAVGNVDPTPASYTWTINTTPAGPVTVTATAGTVGPTNYPTLKDAVDAINAGTHQGAITVSIVSNTTETATSVLNSNGAGSAIYTSVLIRPITDGVTVAGPSLQGRGLIELNGADNVTIDGDNPNTTGTNRNLTLQNTAAATTTFTSVVRIALAATVVNTADNVTIRNLNIAGSAIGRNVSTLTTTSGAENTTFGILAGTGGSTTSATAAPAAITSVATGAASGASASNLVVDNNSIITAARGVSVNGAVATIYPGLQITNNLVGNPVAGNADQVTAIGITAQGSANGVIAGNTVWVEGYIASTAANQGINVGVNNAFGTFTIERNKIARVKNNNSQSYNAYGINLGGSSGHTVQNNFVYGVINDQTAGTGAFSTTFGAYGIRVGSGTGHKIYHNTVGMAGVMGGTTNTNLTAAFGITATTLTGVDVRNNIFSNAITAGNPTGTRNVAIFLPSGATSTMNLTLNNNAYYGSSDAQSRLGQAGATFGTGEFTYSAFDPNVTTPAANWRAYSSTLSTAGTNDNASFATTNAAPFTSATDLHIPAGTATRLESGGAALGVTNDIDLEARNATTPDIGGDEFAGNPPAANDVQATAIVSPAAGSIVLAGGAVTPQATVTNNGTSAASFTVRFKIFNPSSTQIYDQATGVSALAPLSSTTVTFPTGLMGAPGTYSTQLTVTLTGDSVPSNDSLSNTFNVVSAAPTVISVGTGETYTSLTNAGGVFQALNNSGLAANTTINITSDLTAETGAVVLNQIAESGAGGYTLTIKPSGAARVISGTAPSSTALITLNGADRVVFDGSLSGGTDRSLTITNNQATSGVDIWVRSASASNGALNNTFKNLVITGATGSTTVGGILTSGLTLGGDAEAANSGTTITNNAIYRVQNAIYSRGGATAALLDDGLTITNNDLGSATSADKLLFRGMLAGNVKNFVISGNKVFGVQSSSTTTSAMSGIQLALLADTGSVTRNMVSDIKNISTSGVGAYGMQVSTTSTNSNVTIANNFISDVATTGLAAVSSNGIGIMYSGSGTGHKAYFNSISLSTNQTSAQSSAAVFVNSTFATAGAIDLRNNIFSNSQTTGTRYGVYSLAAATVFSAINYNDYFAQNVGFIGGAAKATLSDWQSATGSDTNSKAVDPLFVSTSDLHIQSTSPMLASAVAGTGITTDIDGQTRDTAPDIGADEIVTVIPSADLSITKTDGVTTVTAGGSTTYTITASNAGPDNTMATVADTFPAAVTSVTWTCTTTGGGTCAASGTGNINELVNMPVGSTVKYTATAQISPSATGTLSNTATVAAVSPTVDPDMSHNSDTDTDTITLPAPTVQLSSSSFINNDEGQSAIITLTRSGDLSGTSTVVLTPTNNTATGGAGCFYGVDFVSGAQTVSFAAAAATATVSIPVCSDVLRESGETFSVALSSPSAGTSIGSPSSASVAIVDTASQFRSVDPIGLPTAGGAALTYPSTINVSGFTSNISSMRVTLYDVNIPTTQEIDALLVGPGGQQIVLTHNAGGSATDTTLTFDDAAAVVLPNGAPISSGSYEPTTYGTVSSLPSPAPAAPYNEPGSTVGGTPSMSSVFGGTSPNGQWKLYIRTVVSPLSETGLITAVSGGWGIDFASASGTTTLWGRVINTYGQAVSGVRVTLADLNALSVAPDGSSQKRVAITNGLGYYVFENVTIGHNYALTPTARNYTFDPSSHTITVNTLTEANLLATPNP